MQLLIEKPGLFTTVQDLGRGTARAIVRSSLVDDPPAPPGEFPIEAAQDKERQSLFDIPEGE
jgi:hypothetical protein